MTQVDPQLISSVVDEVLSKLGTGSTTVTPTTGRVAAGAKPAASPDVPTGLGLFREVEPAVTAAADAQRQLAAAGMKTRQAICDRIKQLATDNADAWGKLELDETKIGRLDHKIAKLHLLQKVPATEFLTTQAHSGDEGVSLDEAAPFGVIGVITPVTHSIPTLLANAINMIAAGNSLVANPHPSGFRCAAIASAAVNEVVQREHGIGPLICVMSPPTLETADAIFQHERIPLLVVTGGPGVARAALKQPKRAIVAGPGNPPVVVDETADLDNAAKAIIAGGSFDNNLLCIGEKEVFVVESVLPGLRDALRRNGAMELDGPQIVKLTQAAFKYEKDHYAVNKDYVGRDAQVLGQAAGVSVPAGVDLLFGQTDANNPFVPEEQMMPFVPLVAVRDFEEALDLALEHEHGFGHTAIIHSNNLDRITRMGQACNTTLFVVNGPSTAGLGIGGEAYASYSIATPTGEGVTTPRTFTRFRRGSISGALRFV